MDPAEILEQTRNEIREHSGEDADKWFYANRFVFARLNLDERKTKTDVKKKLFELGRGCHRCGKQFESRTGVHLHRIDGSRGYSEENCALMHPECHRKHHAENSNRGPRPGRPKGAFVRENKTVLTKRSKRYEGKSFLYWWDIWPSLAAEIDVYEEVRFVCKDTGNVARMPVAAIKGFLTKARQTSRSDGNWGIRVLADHENALAFEPGKRGGEWLFLPVTWENDEED